MTAEDEARCRSCDFFAEVTVGMFGEMMEVCAYLVRTGKRRPCKPGTDCTVYKVRGNGGE